MAPVEKMHGTDPHPLFPGSFMLITGNSPHGVISSGTKNDLFTPLPQRAISCLDYVAA